MSLPPITSHPGPPATQPGQKTSEMSLASQAMTPGAIPPGPPSPTLSPPPPGKVAALAPASPHERTSLNLARRPFVNSRPVKRLAGLLWVLGTLLLAGNVSLFWSYLGSSEQTRAALAGAERQTEREKQEVARLSNRISGMNLDQQNREVAYLNRKIAERTFSWSLLFDRLAAVLPDGVRLSQLSPEVPSDKEQLNRTGPIANADKNTPVALQISGEAKNDEALFLFVERLFAHPAFADPDLGREERLDTGLFRFDLKVKYLPNPAAAPARAAASASSLTPASSRGGRPSLGGGKPSSGKRLERAAPTLRGNGKVPP
jgi:Tfp pilus assembly protein PilN